MNDIFQNNVLRGTAYLAEAYSSVILNGDFKGAYNFVLEAITAFGGTAAIHKLSEDLHKMETVKDGVIPKK